MAIALATLVGYSRVYIGIHFPLDVVAGAGIGLVFTKIFIGRKIPLQQWLDGFSGRSRKVFHRTMMAVLAGGGVFLLLFYKQLTNTWFANILGVSAFFVGLFFLPATPKSDCTNFK
jgi:membrane-associated phospholipid phosphatase